MEPNKKSKNETNKSNLKKKPPQKSKSIPPVRQTLTSYKRMLKANPLLKYQEAGIDIDDVIAQKSLGNSLRAGSLTVDSKINIALDIKPSTIEFKKPEAKPLVRTQSLKLPKPNEFSLGTKRPTIISGNQPLANSFFKQTLRNGVIPNATKMKPVELTSKYMSNNKKENYRPRIEVKSKVNSFPKGAPKPKQPNNSDRKPKHPIPQSKNQSSLRRSLSLDHLQTKKGRYLDPKQAYTKLNQSQSEEQLCIPVSNGFKEFSPIMENNGENRNFVFKTPSAYDRRSICHFTPHSIRRTTLFQASTPAPVVMQKLQERLNKWLKSRGKPPASFHHLKVFGSNELKKSPLRIIDDENKENIEVIEEKSESYENLKITTTPERKHFENEDVEIQNELTAEDFTKHAKEAMTDLLKLIQEDFPSDQCLGWLELIRTKYRKIDDEPEYWECRAAIEQSAGNVRNAVEFYKTAIIQGAEVNSVDNSLDQLLKKFSLLNISPKKTDHNSQNDNERIVREARNVFKSSIIQFAVRERNMKKNKDDASIPSAQTSGKKLVAIPVRRSTRLSRSGYTNTSGVKLCTSLREIDLASEEISFEKNKALC